MTSIGLSSILNTAVAGLQAVQTELQWSSDNLSNAQNTDYARRDSVTTSLGSNSVQVNLQRASDNDVYTEMLGSNAQNTYTSTSLGYLTQLGNILGTTTSTPYIQTAMDNFTSAYQSFETDPSDTTSEAQVVATGQALGQSISQASAALGPLRTQAVNDGATAITTLNSNLSQLASINTQISGEPNAQNLNPDLLDKRDALVKAISSQVGVKVLNHADGSVALYTTNGSVLVDHSANQFQWNAPAAGQPWISMSGSPAVSPGLNSGFNTGQISSILNFLDPSTTSTDPTVGTLAKFQTQLDGVASQLAGQTPGTFGGAYYSATADRTTDLPGGTNPAPVAPNPMQSFFVIDNSGPPPALTASQSLAINPALVNGTATVKRQSATPCVTQLTAATRTLNTSGINVTGQTYSQLVSAISSYQTTSQSTTSDDSTRYSTANQTFTTTYSSATGVNVDTEMAKMTVLQNAYSANARVISTVQTMFDALMNIAAS
jgi:flagellar hook-associated protein 1 FlgK